MEITMKAKFSMVTKFLFLLVLALLLPRLGRPASGAHLVVDDNKVECPNAGFTRIQDAIDAASPGDHIRICKGTYVQQLTIRKALDIDADSGTVLMPSAMKQNTTSLFSGAPIATAILVADTTDVSISGLTVDGVNNGISECAPDLEGITFQNASGSIERAAIRNFKLGAGLGGCQSGTGFFVQSGGGRISRVEIADCTIHDFQKNGITANEMGTTAFIQRNVITGIGPTVAIAQNGIQIGFGAGGAIGKNIVTNNLFSTCSAVETCTAVATNILVTQSDGVEVSGNRAGISQVAIFVDGNRAEVEQNQTFATSVFDGIRVEGNQADVRHNRVFNGAESGIFVKGNNNVLEDNVITEAAIGILKETGSMGNVIAMNRFFDTPIAVQDPAPAGLTKKIQPQR
jgi:nitrous oxidase accessory protein NosD